MGDFLRSAEKNKGAKAGGKKESPRGSLIKPRDTTPTLSDLGITKRESFECQRLLRSAEKNRGGNLATLRQRPTGNKMEPVGNLNELGGTKGKTGGYKVEPPAIPTLTELGVLSFTGSRLEPVTTLPFAPLFFSAWRRKPGDSRWDKAAILPARRSRWT